MIRIDIRRRQIINRNSIKINEAIKSAAARAGRSPDGIKLVMVSKNRTVDDVCCVLESRIRDIGENRI